MGGCLSSDDDDGGAVVAIDAALAPTTDGGTEPDASSIDAPDAGTGPDAGVALAGCDQLDVIFVVDDSGSMNEAQSALADAAGLLAMELGALETSLGPAVDYRIGITTTGRDATYTIEPGGGLPPIAVTDQGDNGALLQPVECAGMTRRWLQRGDANLEPSLQCLIQRGTAGPAMTMPLFATELALTARITDGTNAGFRRPDALLGIVVLTDSTECSRDDDGFALPGACNVEAGLLAPDHFVDFYDSFAGARSNWAAVFIAGLGPGECTSLHGSAQESVRLPALVAAAPDSAVMVDFCAGPTFAQQIRDAVAHLAAACAAQ